MLSFYVHGIIHQKLLQIECRCGACFALTFLRSEPMVQISGSFRAARPVEGGSGYSSLTVVSAVRLHCHTRCWSAIRPGARLACDMRGLCCSVKSRCR